MAKNNNNYIQMMYNNQGEDWISLVRAEDIQRNANRICKDMVKGSINYEEVGKAFLDLKFLENLIIGISNELEINTLNLTACQFYMQYCPQTPTNLSAHIAHLGKLNYIYSTILERLNYVKFTGSIGYLADISGLLFNERNHLN